MNISKKLRNRLTLRISDNLGHIFFTFLYKLNNKVYMRYYPRFLKWLGIAVEGQPIYIATTVSFDSSDYSLIKIQEGCVISSYVRLLTHDYSVSRVAVAKGMTLDTEFRLVKGIEIGKNTFIGTHSLIMPGVKVGENSIVGAGSVVTKDVEANIIVAGNPAKKISTIDDYWQKIITSEITLYSE